MYEKNLSETLENYWGYPLVGVTTTFILSLHFEFQFIYYEVKVREKEFKALISSENFKLIVSDSVNNYIVRNSTLFDFHI